MARSVQLLLSVYLLVHLSTFCLISATSGNDETTIASEDDGSSLNLEQKKNYCLRNVTYYEEVAVSKTRKIEIKPTGMLKWFKKSKFEEVNYVDKVRIPRTRLMNDCCEGYVIVANKTCQPVCGAGCPANAFCRAPQKCQCQRGYDAVKSSTISTHYCEPRCASGCPHGGRCVAPEICECAPGYQFKAGSCAPTCASGCLNGRCAALNLCTCNEGYTKQASSGECVPLDECENVECETEDPSSSSSRSIEPTADEITVTISYDLEITDSSDDVDAGSGNGLENNVNVDDDVDDDGNVLFPSNTEAANCTLQPCLGDTVCKLVGSCTCADGFIRHQPASVNDEEVGPYCAPIIKGDEALQNGNIGADGWGGVFFVAMGVIVMMVALMVLAIKWWQHQRGSMDVEAKNDMCCTYDKNSTSSDSGHVNMN